MKRRSYIRGGAGLVAGLALAGCSSDDPAPPARKAVVFDDVTLEGTTLNIELVSQPEVETRNADAGGEGAVAPPEGVVGSLLPVGVASGAKGSGGGRGAGGYSSAPRGRHGWAVWRGHDDDDWRENHQEELTMATATVAAMGVAYVGTDDSYEQSPPGPGPVPWDREWSDPNDGLQTEVDLAAISRGEDLREGWYRVGTKLVAENSQADFGWQAADFEIDDELSGTTIDKEWHVRPQV